MRARWLSARGFSPVETAAVIGAVSVMSATAAPHLRDYLETAHLTKAGGDVKVIAVSVVRLTTHVGRIGGHQRVKPELLVSDGEVPASANPAAAAWTPPVDDGRTQSMSAHFVDNSAGYADDPGNPLRWRGPYFEGLSADPWGRRYALNVGAMYSGRSGVVMVISAGANGVIDTPFDARALPASTDDIIGLIGRAP